MASSATLFIVAVVALLSVASGTDVDHGRKLLQSSSTFSRSDRATAAIGASSDAINAAVAGTRTAKQATRDGVLFSRLAANAGSRPADFLGGRKLLQSSSTFSRSDRATAAIGASSDAINAAIAGTRTAKQATRDGVLFSRLAANAGARPADFLGGRKLLQSSSTFSRSDRATAAIGASSDAINAAVAGDRTAKQATRDGVLFSRLAANAGARPADFLGGR